MTVEEIPSQVGDDVCEIPDQVGDDELFYWFKIGVRFIWVEDLVAVHYCHEVFSF